MILRQDGRKKGVLARIDLGDSSNLNTVTLQREALLATGKG